MKKTLSSLGITAILVCGAMAADTAEAKDVLKYYQQNNNEYHNEYHIDKYIEKDIDINIYILPKKNKPKFDRHEHSYRPYKNEYKRHRNRHDQNRTIIIIEKERNRSRVRD